MLDKLALLALLSMVPVFELRLSIPLGIMSRDVALGFGLTLPGFGLPWQWVFVVAVTANFAAGILVYEALHLFLGRFLRFRPFAFLYAQAAARAERKSHALIEKYGWLGLALFMAIPLPGTGVWTAALVAYLLNLSWKCFALACALGVLLAGVLVTVASLGFFQGVLGWVVA